MQKFCLFSLVGPWALFTRFGALAAIHPRWGNRYDGSVTEGGVFAKISCNSACSSVNFAISGLRGISFYLANSRRFFTFLRIVDHFMALLGVRRGFKMILSHRALTSLNMSSYRAIWTHFRRNFIFLGRKNLRSWPKISDCQKSKLFQKSKSPHLAILIHI